MAEEEAVEPRKANEDERVSSHREEMFRALGFNELQVEALADAGADWHEAANLLKRGCPLDTALDLLL